MHVVFANVVMLEFRVLLLWTMTLLSQVITVYCSLPCSSTSIHVHLCCWNYCTVYRLP